MGDNLMQLQRQAAQRVQRMQERSRQVLATYHAEGGCEPTPQGRSLPRLEAEQWLLLGLALLLMRCGGRTELTLALLYLAL